MSTSFIHIAGMPTLSDTTDGGWRMADDSRSEWCHTPPMKQIVSTDALVNLRGGDDKYMDTVAKWYRLFCIFHWCQSDDV